MRLHRAHVHEGFLPSHARFAGVRSFGYREGEHAVVVFNTPLTIIVGQNGAGKTVSS